MSELRAELIPIERSGLYHVRLDGELVIQRSRNPECDLARLLFARGRDGVVTMIDAFTGKPRSYVNIAKAAAFTVEEGPNGPRFVKLRQSRVDRAPAGETVPPASAPYPEVKAAFAGAATQEGAAR